jgi:peptidoglycan hydrolase-like protein with peptidoglycan-binding domain
MDELTASVGQNGRNLEEDVRLVQRLLEAAGCNPGPVDGCCGANTIAAIRKYQCRLLSDPDGLIEPGKTTWKSLCAGDITIPGPGEWGGDSSQWSQEKKLQSLTPKLRDKVRPVILALKARGFEPEIFYGWRSVQVQLELVRKGCSKVKFSFHNAQKPNGTPDAYAADIIDGRYGWDDEAAESGFWKALGEEAEEQGIVWGSRWSRFRDWAHVQLVDNSCLKQIKKQSGL